MINLSSISERTVTPTPTVLSLSWWETAKITGAVACSVIQAGAGVTLMASGAGIPAGSILISTSISTGSIALKAAWNGTPLDGGEYLKQGAIGAIAGGVSMGAGGVAAKLVTNGSGWIAGAMQLGAKSATGVAGNVTHGAVSALLNQDSKHITEAITPTRIASAAVGSLISSGADKVIGGAASKLIPSIDKIDDLAQVALHATVGGATGATGSAVTTMVSNKFQGKELTKGVGEAALTAAISGAVIGAAGAANKIRERKEQEKEKVPFPEDDKGEVKEKEEVKNPQTEEPEESPKKPEPDWREKYKKRPQEKSAPIAKEKTETPKPAENDQPDMPPEDDPSSLYGPHEEAFADRPEFLDALGEAKQSRLHEKDPVFRKSLAEREAVPGEAPPSTLVNNMLEHDMRNQMRSGMPIDQDRFVQKYSNMFKEGETLKFRGATYIKKHGELVLQRPNPRSLDSPYFFAEAIQRHIEFIRVQNSENMRRDHELMHLREFI